MRGIFGFVCLALVGAALLTNSKVEAESEPEWESYEDDSQKFPIKQNARPSPDVGAMSPYLLPAIKKPTIIQGSMSGINIPQISPRPRPVQAISPIPPSGQLKPIQLNLSPSEYEDFKKLPSSQKLSFIQNIAARRGSQKQQSSVFPPGVQVEQPVYTKPQTQPVASSSQSSPMQLNLSPSEFEDLKALPPSQQLAFIQNLIAKRGSKKGQNSAFPPGVQVEQPVYTKPQKQQSSVFPPRVQVEDLNVYNKMQKRPVPPPGVQIQPKRRRRPPPRVQVEDPNVDEIQQLDAQPEPEVPKRVENKMRIIKGLQLQYKSRSDSALDGNSPKPQPKPVQLARDYIPVKNLPPVLKSVPINFRDKSGRIEKTREVAESTLEDLQPVSGEALIVSQRPNGELVELDKVVLPPPSSSGGLVIKLIEKEEEDYSALYSGNPPPPGAIN